MKRSVLPAAVLTSALLLCSCGMGTEQTINVQTDPAETEAVLTQPEVSPSAASSATAETSAARVTETSSEETDESSAETSGDPGDLEGEPLSAEESSAFFASYADTYLMSSGVGGWGAYMTVAADGSFDYNYHDADYDMYYICHAQGRLGSVVQLDEFVYKVEVLEMSFEYQADSTWTVQEPDGAVINYTASDSAGVHQGDILIFYAAGNAVSALPDGYLWWYCAPRAMQTESVADPFPLNGYYNAVDDCAYIEDDYE